MVKIFAKAEKSIDTSSKKTLLNICFWGITLFLMMVPFMKGLFYRKEFVRAQIVLGIIVLIYGIARIFTKKEKMSFNIQDIMAIVFFLSYAISLFTAVHLKEAIIGVFEVLNYVVVYFLVKDLTIDKKKRTIITSAVFLATAIFSLVALMVAVGALEIHIPSEYGDKRIISLLEHPNAYGIYTVMGIMLGLGLLKECKSIYLKILVSLGIIYNSIGMLGSQSRGSWLVLGLMLILWLLFSGKGYFKENIYNLLSLLIIIFIAGKGYLDGYFAKNFDQSIQWLIVGTIMTAVIIFLLHWLSKKIENNYTLNRYKQIIPWVIGINLIIVSGFYFVYTAKYLPSPTTQVLSKEVIHRADSIGGESSSFQGRLSMYNWAFAMLKDGFVLGRGADGYHALYHRYQDKIYWAKHVHSHFLQIWIEAGVFAFMSYIILWLALIYQVIKSLIRRLDDDDWPFALGIFLGMLAMIIHSVVDFDLSLPALSITLWTLAGIVRNETRIEYGRGNFGIKKWITPIVGVVLSVVLILPAWQEYKALSINEEAEEAWCMGYYPMAIVKYEEALKLSPLSSDISAKLSQLYAKRYELKKREDFKEKAMEYAKKAQELSPYNVRNYVRLSNTYELIQEEEMLISNVEMLAYVVPKSLNIQENLASKYYQRAFKYLKEDNKALAEMYMQKVSNILETVEKNYLESDKAWNMRPTAKLFLMGGQSASLFGEKETATERLSMALKFSNTREEAGQWLAYVYSGYDEVNYKRFFKSYIEKKQDGEKKYEKIKEYHKHIDRGSV